MPLKYLSSAGARVMAEVTRRVQQARAAAWDAGDRKLLQPFNPLHILLAEDDECTRLVVKQLLKRSGYRGDTSAPLAMSACL